MAETIVAFVLEKITDALVKEVQHLRGVADEVEKVRRELDWIRAFLVDADRKQIEAERQKQWVREVREVAYWIEDVIDTFVCEVSQQIPGKRLLGGQLKAVPVIHKLGNEIKEIQARIKEINDFRERYGVNSLGVGSGEVKMLPVKPPVLPDIEDPDVIGLDEDRDNIHKQLFDETMPRLCVVSIVGPGGLGKTTLAKKVYNSDEVKRQYNIRIWIAISQEYKLIDVSKKILNNLQNIKENEQGKDEEYFLTEVYKSLKNRKYLVILDDVWTTNLWMTIKRVMPSDNNGSRIIITTRNIEVAKDADPVCEPYKLNFLSEKTSLELFLRKAFLKSEIQNGYPSELLDLAKQFVRKCSGLPLALVVLGGYLAQKQPTYLVWKQVMDTMIWYPDIQKMCMEIIGTSFDDLPLALKSCFMYFAAFPEDYDIQVKLLLRMWIAEGFIPHEENRTLEDTAQSFLEDLAQRNMIQVTMRFLYDDSTIWCRIHDLLRDVAIQKAKDDNFLTVSCSNQDCVRVRRVAVHNSDGNQLVKLGNSNLRTLLCFNSVLPDCSGQRLLKVLSDMGGLKGQAGGSDSGKGEMKNLQGLSHIRYLNLSHGSVMWNLEHFKTLIGSMKFLQTLNLTSRYDHLPDCIWKIITLRHVNLPFNFYTLGPPPSSDLRNLQTLIAITTRDSWEPTTLPKMPNLRSLSIEIIDGFSLALFVDFLAKLVKLEDLTIKARYIPKEVVDMSKFPFYEHLTFLEYKGMLYWHDRQEPIKTTMFPTHITRLSFWHCELCQDDLIALEKLHGLKWLELVAAFPHQTMKISAGGFPGLLELYFTDIQDLEKWDIEEGAMPMLKEHCILDCPMLQVPQGLRHLTALRSFSWTGLRGESGCVKANEIRNICKHVPSINFWGLDE